MSYRVQHIDPKHSAMIIIDMQHDFLAVGAPLEVESGRAMIPTLQRALDHARAVGMPIIYTAHEHRRDGSDMGLHRETHRHGASGLPLLQGDSGVRIVDAVGPLLDDIVITKRRYSGFFGTDLEIVLRGLQIRTVILAGVTTENCVHATARDAMYRDFRVAILADACASIGYVDDRLGALRADEVHRATLINLAATTADVMSTSDMIDRTPKAE